MISLFPDGHDILSDQLTYTQTSREWEDRERFTAWMAGNYGVVSGLVVTDVSDGSGNKVSVSAGLAYDSDARRLPLASATEITGITFGVDEDSYVVLRYGIVDSNNTIHRITGVSAATLRNEAPTLHIVSSVTAASGEVCLAQITDIVTGGSPSVTLADTEGMIREVLQLDPTRFSASSSALEHRLSAHAEGISGGTGALTASVIHAAIDSLAIQDLSASEYVSINGYLLSSDETNPISDVTFDGGDAIGTWNIYMDYGGNVGKTQAALIAGQFLIATVVYEADGDLESLTDARVFLEMTQDLVRADTTEAETNDTIATTSTLKNNLNKIRYRINALEEAGRAYTVIANSGGDYNGATDAVFTSAVAGMPASGGTILVADGEYNFASTVTISKPIKFISHRGSVINLDATPTTAFIVNSDKVTFDGLVFNTDNTSSGAVDYDIITSNSRSELTVKNSYVELFSTGGGEVEGQFIKIEGSGHSFSVENNYITSEIITHSFGVVEIDSVGTVSGICIKDNTTKGQNGFSLFYVEKGTVYDLDITDNIGEVINTTSEGDNQWITSTLNTNVMENVLIADNNYNCNDASGIGPRFINMYASVSSEMISVTNNIARFAVSIHTSPITMSIGIVFNKGSFYRIEGNQIKSSYYGIHLSNIDKSRVGGNILNDIQGLGIDLETGSDNCLILGNIIDGSGTIGIDISSNNNIIDDNLIDIGFTDLYVDDGSNNNVCSGTDNTTNDSM